MSDFRKWYQGVKFVFNLDKTKCKVSFYNEHLFDTTDKGTLRMLEDNPEHFMQVYFKNKFNLNY